MSRRKTYGFTKEKAERISRHTEEAYLRLSDKASNTKEQLSDFDLEDFIDLTNVQEESVVSND